MVFRVAESVARSTCGTEAAASCAGCDVSTCDSRGDEEGGVEQACDAAYVATFVYNASSGERDGYSDGPGFAGAHGCGDDTDLHACDEEAGAGCEEPAGFLSEEFRVKNAESRRGRRMEAFDALRSAQPKELSALCRRNSYRSVRSVIGNSGSVRYPARPRAQSRGLLQCETLSVCRWPRKDSIGAEASEREYRKSSEVDTGNP